MKRFQLPERAFLMLRIHAGSPSGDLAILSDDNPSVLGPTYRWVKLLGQPGADFQQAHDALLRRLARSTKWSWAVGSLARGNWARVGSRSGD